MTGATDGTGGKGRRRPGMPAGVTATVYRYAARGDLPPEAMQEMRRAHRRANKLTEIELAYEDAKAEAWASHPEVGEADQAVAGAAAEVARLRSEIAAAKAAGRAGRPDPALAAALKAARESLAAAKAARKQARDTWYGPVIEPLVTAAARERDAAVKATYAADVAAGLYWGSVNAVTDHHLARRGQVAAARGQGRPAGYRFRRWTGEGTLAVQLQRMASDPPRSPAAVASASGKWANAARLAPWEPPGEFAALPRAARGKIARQGTLRFRIGSGPAACHVTIPVTIHRMPPAEADITGIQVTRRVCGGIAEVSVAVTCRLPAPPARTEGPLVAVHSGWRVLDDGSLRVAVVAGAGKPPAWLAEIRQWHGSNRSRRSRSGPPGAVVRDHGDWAEILVPAAWREARARHEKARGHRDDALNAALRHLAGWLEARPGMRAWLDPDGTMTRWRSPERLARAARALRSRGGLAAAFHGEGAPSVAEMAAYLAGWERQDRHLHQMEARGRKHLLARRDDCWRQCAAWITARAALVVMDEWQIAPLARRPDVTGEDDPQAAAARANRVLAAPGSLRQFVRIAAGRRGVTVREAGPAEGPAVHHACGMPFRAADRMASVMVWCPSCEVLADQDRNALLIMTGEARGER